MSRNSVVLGKIFKGLENNNRESPVDFCEDDSQFTTNRAFSKTPARNITPWVESISDNRGQNVNILCKHNKKHLLSITQSFGGTLVTSDHKVVKAKH